MKKIYTHQDINKFFTQFKELPNSYEFDKVHQLINNPNARARQLVNLNHKPLKIIIMTSAFIAGTAALMLWLAPDKTIEVAYQQVLKTQERNQISLAEARKEPIFPEEVTHKVNTENALNIKVEQSRGYSAMTEMFADISDSKWPADSVIDGEKFIVTLSDEELESLGFEIDESGLYYKNIYQGKAAYFHSRWDTNHGEITNVIPFEKYHNKKKTFSENDFYPVSVSNLSYASREFKRDVFIMMNDTLLPILIKRDQLKYGKENLLIWFKIAKSLFDYLPDRYKYLKPDFDKIISLKRQNQNKDLVEYKARNIMDGLHFIELSKAELQKLGFIFRNNRISYPMNISLENLNSGDYQEIWLIPGGQGGGVFSDSVFYDIGIKLSFISNELGEQNIKWKTQNDDEDKFTFQYFQKKMQFLVPVLLRKADYKDILYQNQIFWFEPSQALFDSLPEIIGDQLKQEFEYFTEDRKENQKSQTSSCIYYEACRSSLDVEDFRIYPNPANFSATVDFSLRESIKGSISLINISGVQMNFLVPATKFSEGKNSFIIDISDILPGIYLVLLSTDKGFKTQRLIISR